MRAQMSDILQTLNRIGYVPYLNVVYPAAPLIPTARS